MSPGLRLAGCICSNAYICGLVPPSAALTLLGIADVYTFQLQVYPT
jgi:hypothetical protein